MAVVFNMEKRLFYSVACHYLIEITKKLYQIQPQEAVIQNIA
jgi:hypothetical protein